MPNQKKKKEFGEGLIYTLANYIYWFLQGNFYFWLMNIPFIVVFLFMFLSKGDDFVLVLTISAIPIGPALTALFSVMGKLVREKDVSVTNSFFKSYKANFFESLFFWILELIALYVIHINKVYALLHSNVSALQAIFLVLTFICISMAFHIFPIISRFYLKKLDVIKLALYYSIKKIYISLLGLALIYIMWTILFKVPSLSLLVIVLSISIISYIIMYLYKNILLELEEKFKSDIN